MNVANKNRSLYVNFKEQLLSEGILKWRYHSPDKDVCVMSDTNDHTGVLLPTSFVHVTATQDSTGEEFLTCTCHVYKCIQRSGKDEHPLWPVQEEIPDANFTCVHCRFYKQHLVGAFDKLQQQNTELSRPLGMVHNSLQYMNMPIQLLGNVLPQGTTKFSVKGIESYSIVNFSIYQNKMFVKCMDGLCAVQLANQKKFPKTLSIEVANDAKHKKEREKLCCHINTIYDNIDYIRGFFPGYFNTENAQQTNIPDDVNMEDANLVSPPRKFNTETGLWNFPAHSQHKPHEMLDIDLIQNTQMCNDLVHSRNFNSNTGQYDALHLKPEITICECGHGFDSNEYERKGSATIYSRNGPICCIYYNIKCKSGKCEKTYHEEAKKQGIFFLSSVTAVGDEVGWDFVSLVMKSKMSFCGFTLEMTRHYQTTNILSAPFISPSTFVKWFFAWLAAFEIDF